MLWICTASPTLIGWVAEPIGAPYLRILSPAAIVWRAILWPRSSRAARTTWRSSTITASPAGIGSRATRILSCGDSNSKRGSVMVPLHNAKGGESLGGAHPVFDRCGHLIFSAGFYQGLSDYLVD